MEVEQVGLPTEGPYTFPSVCSLKVKFWWLCVGSVNYPEVSERLGWTTVLLRIFSLVLNFKQRLWLRRLKRLSCLYAPAYTEHLHFEPGNGQAFCIL
jgi:hypothetical protein